MPVDEVKIDRSFIEGVADSPQDRAIVGSVVWLCRTLGKDVVAEGVETEEQYEALAQLGCTHAQGYYIARPLPAADCRLTFLGRSGRLDPTGADTPHGNPRSVPRRRQGRRSSPAPAAASAPAAPWPWPRPAPTSAS